MRLVQDLSFRSVSGLSLTGFCFGVELGLFWLAI